ncbi:UDP-N-acetylmuramoyl-tripeptide--D-alanyl-D-alanine ligase [Bacteroidota bacterium]
MDLQAIYKIFRLSSGICIDSRKVSKNSIFIALKGDNFNGNKFASKAIENGCTNAIIDDANYYHNESYILVDNCLDTLQKLATFHRKAFNIPVIAITGTNGKTTSKELIASVLKKKFNTIATIGNFNNHIGLPLTLLSINKETEICIVEMGANHSGEIKQLCEIAQPTSGLITNIGYAHIEGFGSIEGIINAKKELFDYLVNFNGQLFVNSNSQEVSKLYPGQEEKSYGSSDHSSYIGNILSCDPFLCISWQKKSDLNKSLTLKQNSDSRIIKTNLIGSYNFENVMSAICLGDYFNVDDQLIKEGIEEYSPDNNRSQYYKSGNNDIFLDAYNANPTSMIAALDNFLKLNSKNKVIILGDMLELGISSKEEHIKIIKYISNNRFQSVFLVGKIFSSLNLPEDYTAFENTSFLKEYLKKNNIKSSSILLKGSRKIGLEDLRDVL